MFTVVDYSKIWLVAGGGMSLRVIAKTFHYSYCEVRKVLGPPFDA